MLQILLHRYEYLSERTFGRIYINGTFICDALEDTYRDLEFQEKVYGKTAIPAGTYKVVYNYSPHFKRKLPLLVNVPHFEGIRIHPGNTEDDSLGCILVGTRQDNILVKSKIALEKLIAFIENEKDIIIVVHNSSTCSLQNS